MPPPLVLVLYVLLWIVVAAECVLLCGLARRMFGLGSALLAQVASDGPPLGSLVPEIPAVDANGEPRRLGGRDERLQAILFLSTHCPSCRAATMWLGTMRDRGDLSSAVVVSGSASAVREFGMEFECGHPLIPDPRQEISGRFQVNSTPFTMILDPAGRVIGKGFTVYYRDLCDLLKIAEMRASMNATHANGRTQADVV
jgi:hypothetical protein